MFGLVVAAEEQAKEDQKWDLQRKKILLFDEMLTIAKKALENIAEIITNPPNGVININQLQAIALAALLKIERKGK